MKRPDGRLAKNTSRPAPKIERQVKPAEPVKTARPAKPAEPARALKTVKAAKATKAPKSAKAPKPVRAAKPGKASVLSDAVAVRKADRAAARQRRREARRFTSTVRQRRWFAGLTLSVVALLGSTILIATYSPLLAVQRIVVSGTDRIPQSAIKKALKGELNKPLPQVSSDEISTLLKPFRLIQSFAVVSIPPHTLEVRIVERQPIAIVKIGGNNFLYDPAGIQLGKANNLLAYPTIVIQGNPSDSENFSEAIDVLMALPTTLLPKVNTIEAKTKDNVVITLRGYSSRKIIWGDSSNSILKSRDLSALLANNTGNASVIDVSSPTAPVVRQ